VSTPIGNLEDITIRAAKTLYSVDYLACEDTRKTGLLLKNLREKNLTCLTGETATDKSKSPRLISYYEGKEDRKIPQIIKLLKEGKEIALTSNAGTPLISDPGFKLVRECLSQKIKVETIPGASAVLTALTGSGLPTDKFIFIGYLPKKAGKRKKILDHLAAAMKILPATVVIYLTPHRLLKDLEVIRNIFGDINIVLCRELTKIYEEIRRERITCSLAFFSQNKPKGEFTLVFRTEEA